MGHLRRVWLACADDGVNEWDDARTFVRVQAEVKTTDGEVLSTFDRCFISNEKPGRFSDLPWCSARTSTPGSVIHGAASASGVGEACGQK